MEEFGPIWEYGGRLDELKQKLVYISIEFESERQKHQEEVKHLMNLLNIASQERDEAKEQLQKLFSKILLSGPTELLPFPPPAQAQPDSSLVFAAKTNSSITDSSSLSDTCNRQSHVSSPVDSFLDAVTSPEFSTFNAVDSSHIGFLNGLYQDYNNGSTPTSFVPPSVVMVPTGLVAPPVGGQNDPADAVIDNIVKGKAMPQKGKLLEAVMAAGPLLDTLTLTGPLPQWRNPPPLQHFKIPPVSIKGCESPNKTNEKTTASTSCLARKPFMEIRSQMCSAPMLNFATGASCLGQGNDWLLTSGATNQFPAGKRQRFL